MWSSIVSFLGKGLSALGKNGVSLGKRVVKQSAESFVESTGNSITGFLNGQNNQQNQQQNPINPLTKTLLPLALTNPAVLIPFLIVLAVVGLLLIVFAFITQVMPWPTGLLGS
jgi:hypothetical protein